MAKPNNILIYTNIFFIIFACGLLAEKFLTRSPSSIIEECSCACHALHRGEEEQVIIERKKERAQILEKKAQESNALMEEQYQVCSQPFKDFMEYVNKN